MFGIAVIRSRYGRRVSGRQSGVCRLKIVPVGHEHVVAGPMTEPRREYYRGLMVADGRHRRPGWLPEVIMRLHCSTPA